MSAAATILNAVLDVATPVLMQVADDLLAGKGKDEAVRSARGRLKAELIKLGYDKATGLLK